MGLLIAVVQPIRHDHWPARDPSSAYPCTSLRHSSRTSGGALRYGGPSQRFVRSQLRALGPRTATAVAILPHPLSLAILTPSLPKPCPGPSSKRAGAIRDAATALGGTRRGGFANPRPRRSEALPAFSLRRRLQRPTEPAKDAAGLELSAEQSLIPREHEATCHLQRATRDREAVICSSLREDTFGRKSRRPGTVRPERPVTPSPGARPATGSEATTTPSGSL